MWMEFFLIVLKNIFNGICNSVSYRADQHGLSNYLSSNKILLRLESWALEFL